MSSKAIATEWLALAKKNLETAELLLSVDHYTDVIATDIYQTIEKAVKALYAFNNTQIPRIHQIPKLMAYASKHVSFSDIEENDLFIINDYYLNTRYPGPQHLLPSKEEVTHNLTIENEFYILSFLSLNKTNHLSPFFPSKKPRQEFLPGFHISQ